MNNNPRFRRIAVGAFAGFFALSSVAQTVPSTALTYNSASRVSQVTRPSGQVHGFQYNLDGQVITHNQPNPASSGTLGQVQYGFNARGDLTSVTDPRSLATAYGVSGFGETGTQSSPDTGSTSYTRDVAGRVTSRANALGSATFTYDTLDRLTSADYGDFAATFVYDGTANGVGQLTSMTDPSGATIWDYDKLGRATSKVQTTGGVSLSAAYAYNGGRVTSITYPSGAVVTFAYSGAQVTGIAVNGTTVLSNVAYAPFGAPMSWTMGSAGAYSRALDSYGRVASYTYDGGNRTLEWDNSSRLTALNNPDGSRWAYTYDNLDRLIGADETASRGFQHDLNGNRTAETVNGTTFNYSGFSSSNRLGSSASPAETRSYAYDGVGNITSDGIRTFTWNNAGYLAASTGPAGTASYLYNGFGQRVRKSSGAGVRHFFYAEDGITLLGEYGSTGAASTVSETVYIGDTPVLVLRGGSVFYVLPDHLNTPRVVRDSSGTTVWRWHSDAFGVAGPNENPGGVALFNWNARFPGQYFDSETGLYYNNARYYDAATGRYYSSDPIGLAGGLNTYGYAEQRPTGLTDPTGNLSPAAVGAIVGFGFSALAKTYDLSKKGESLSWANVGRVAAAGAGGALAGATGTWFGIPGRKFASAFLFNAGTGGSLNAATTMADNLLVGRAANCDVGRAFFVGAFTGGVGGGLGQSAANWGRTLQYSSNIHKTLSVHEYYSTPTLWLEPAFTGTGASFGYFVSSFLANEL